MTHDVIDKVSTAGVVKLLKDINHSKATDQTAFLANYSKKLPPNLPLHSPVYSRYQLTGKTLRLPPYTRRETAANRQITAIFHSPPSVVKLLNISSTGLSSLIWNTTVFSPTISMASANDVRPKLSSSSLSRTLFLTSTLASRQMLSS